ncbi:lysophospholipid acyltransferase family protein, partial [Mycoplasmopsis bovis]|uniref:lysophospholipid acyltransferase family protein n=1 Tax=Mycoplasmopsis bovis TaxID=28903 RepID=UPI003D2D04D1
QQRNDWLLRKARFFLWLFGVKVIIEGYDNIPKGAVIIAPNHKSNVDPVLVLYALKKQTKEENIRNRIPTFLAKIELSKKRTKFIKFFNSITRIFSININGIN